MGAGETRGTQGPRVTPGPGGTREAERRGHRQSRDPGARACQQGTGVPGGCLGGGTVSPPVPVPVPAAWQRPYLNVFKHFRVEEWKRSAREGDVAALTVTGALPRGGGHRPWVGSADPLCRPFSGRTRG